MKKLISILLGSWVLLGGMSGRPARANFYDESCQTIRLHGQLVVPTEYKSKRPLELTVAYQLNFQTHPSYFRVNLPVGQSEFQINIAGYRPREPGDLYIPMMFWYPRAVKFAYYVKSFDGKWISPMLSTTYLPAVTRIEEVGECQPDLYLETLALKKKFGGA